MMLLYSYRELCSMAADIGQPHLVYDFLALAQHSKVWRSKRGAAFAAGGVRCIHFYSIVQSKNRYFQLCLCLVDETSERNVGASTRCFATEIVSNVV
jgi:hypothetical protein